LQRYEKKPLLCLKMYKLFIMNRNLRLLLCILALSLCACTNGNKQSASNQPSGDCENPLTLNAMHLKGPVKVMTKSFYDANVIWNCNYYFDTSGKMTHLTQELSNCGDECTVNFDACGKVTDTVFNLEEEYGCFDPELDLVELDLNPTAVFTAPLADKPALLPADALRHTSAVIGELLVENDLNDYGCVTHYCCSSEEGDVCIDFTYEADGVTLSHIHVAVLSGEEDYEEDYEAKEYDEQGNPTQWPIASPIGPFDETMFYMFSEFIPGLYLVQFQYAY